MVYSIGRGGGVQKPPKPATKMEELRSNEDTQGPSRQSQKIPISMMETAIKGSLNDIVLKLSTIRISLLAYYTVFFLRVKEREIHTANAKKK